MAAKRRVFFSFHYEADAWRAAQIRNTGVVEGNETLTDNQWEEVVGGGDDAIRAWIDSQLAGKSCAIVLIGSNTAERRWVEYEIRKAWIDGKGLLGIYIHNLKHSDGNQSRQGRNPFDYVSVADLNLAAVVPTYNPPHSISTDVLAYIAEYISIWVEYAIRIREDFRD